MRIVVPDASVILKWILADPTGEQDVDKAIALRDAVIGGEIAIRVPSLWIYEVGNILTRKFAKHAGNALAALVAFGMDERRTEGDLLSRTVALTQSCKVTFYDAAYHALALEENGTFVTADARYLRKAAKVGAVTLLSEWK
ncbi:MAG TPA: type II toxin-antitoxin system VapC family toxin [Gammaproteobacteria bacterium]|nr:type II toxin-antitoxin system VapC family toxin [Gammaproteobacteria bacterium]